MSLGPFCKGLGIDEEVLNGDKTITCDPKSITNGVIWELRKYKMSKKLTAKEMVDWLIKICNLQCENTEQVQSELNEKLEKVSNFRATFLKAPKKYPDEIDRLMKWEFEFPSSMGVEPAPVFEPVVRASLGPKLLKVLKEKAAADDDSMDMSGPSDDDDEQAKRRKAREEIVQLKKDLTVARKVITGLNDRLNDLTKRCAFLSDASKTSVSERRRIKADVDKLKTEWNDEIGAWHDCIERLNHVNSNKGDYMDVGYMVRRNKTKQGIFDELSFEFEKILDEFKHKVNNFLDKERRSKKKSVAREYRQKSKSDRKRVRQESGDTEDAKKVCLSEEAKEQTPTSMSVEEFMKSEKVDEFKGGKFANSLRAIYSELTSMPVQCKDVQEIMFSVLDSLENLNVEKIPSQSFAGNIYMEARMLVLLQTYSDLIDISKISFANDSETGFKLNGMSYEVALPNKTSMVLGVLDISGGSPDTSLNLLKDLFGQLMSAKLEVHGWDSVAQTLKSTVFAQHLLDRKLIEILFLYKQHIAPHLKRYVDLAPSEISSKIISLNNFCTGVYFLTGLAELADVTVLAWELMSQNAVGTGSETSAVTSHGQTRILSKAMQQVYTFCQALDPYEEVDDFGRELSSFLKKDKKVSAMPLAPYRMSLFNVIFHNSAGLWFFQEIGLLAEFLEKIKEEDIKSSSVFDTSYEKQLMSVARALGLIGKLVAVPLWTVLEDYDVEIGKRYASFLKKVESWAKDSSSFMKGQDRLFEDVPVTHDAVYVSLIKDNEANNAGTKELLELVFTAFVPYIKAFLYGGSFGAGAINGETPMEVDSDDKIAIHKDFGTFDRISKNLHALPTYAHDALMLYSKTRNGVYQDKLCNKNNQKIFELMQRNANRQLKSLYKRKIKLNEIRDQGLDRKEEDSRCLLIEKRYKLIDELIKWGGLWKSEKEVDERLKDMKENDRMNALKSQIRFRRHVLCESHEDGLLDLANDGECFNSSKLYENLKAVLHNECTETETDIFELASATDSETLKNRIYESCKNAEEIEDGADLPKNYGLKENFHWLLGKLVSHTVVRGAERETLSGVCIARKKVEGVYSYFIRYKGKDVVYKFSEAKIAEDYKNQNLRLIEPTPKDFAGARLSRAFFKDDGDLEWYDCRVIDTDVTGPEFVVEFDFYGSDMLAQEGQAQVPEVEVLTFTSHLLEDYRTDRLRFL